MEMLRAMFSFHSLAIQEVGDSYAIVKSELINITRVWDKEKIRPPPRPPPQRPHSFYEISQSGLPFHFHELFGAQFAL